jgi:hypothetical protein
MPPVCELTPDPGPCTPVYKPESFKPTSMLRLFEPVLRKLRTKKIFSPEGFKDVEYTPELPRPELPKTGPPSYGPLPASLRWLILTMPKVPAELNARSGRVLCESNPRIANLLEAWERMLLRHLPEWNDEMLYAPWERDMSPGQLVEIFKARLNATELDDEAAEWFRRKETRMQRDEEQWRRLGKEQRAMDMMEDMKLDEPDPNTEPFLQEYECLSAWDPGHICDESCTLMRFE